MYGAKHGARAGWTLSPGKRAMLHMKRGTLMNDETRRAGGASATPAKSDSGPLAQWLLRLMREPRTASSPAPTSSGEGGVLASQRSSEGHRQFFQQLPDFVTALLLQDEGATLRYAPLLYHLVGCDNCHQAYLEIYDAMRAALSSQDESIACLEDGAPPVG
jgi:hypothetical protein